MRPAVQRDEWLAVRCQLGEPAAFDALIERWHGPLWGFVRRVVGDDDAARDILQDIWVRVIRGFPRLRDGRWEWDGEVHQLEVSSPERPVAIHGLVSWQPWTVLDRAEGVLSLGTIVEPRSLAISNSVPR